MRFIQISKNDWETTHQYGHCDSKVSTCWLTFWLLVEVLQQPLDNVIYPRALSNFPPKQQLNEYFL